MSKILLIGFGSIGRRHLQNLQRVGKNQLIVYRTGLSTLPDDELVDIPVTNDLNDALAHKPVAVIIANPTACHISMALAAAKAGCHLLIEKPISHSMDGVEELVEIVRMQNLTVLVGFQFRFHPGLQQIKHLLDNNAIGPVVNVQAHWGEYLPAWHPWEDYRNSYSARSDLGGGVLSTLSHPFDYLRWLIGDVSAVSAMLGYQGGLEISVEDTANVQLKFDTGVIGHVHLDYVQQPPSHWLRIIGQHGTLYWDNADGEVHYYSVQRGQWEILEIPKDFERNSLFVREIEHFLACIAGMEHPICTLQDGIRVLEITLAAQQSEIEKRQILL